MFPAGVQRFKGLAAATWLYLIARVIMTLATHFSLPRIERFSYIIGEVMVLAMILDGASF